MDKYKEEKIIQFKGTTFSTNEDVIKWIDEALTEAYEKGRKDLMEEEEGLREGTRVGVYNKDGAIVGSISIEEAQKSLEEEAK